MYLFITLYFRKTRFGHEELRRVWKSAKRETVKILKTSRRVKNAKSTAAQSLQGLPLGDACAISAAGPALLENVQGSRKVKNICSRLPSRVWPNYASENVPASRNVWSCVHTSAKPCLLHIARFCLFFFALRFVAHAEHSRAHTEIFHRVRKQAALHLQRGLILDEALLTRSKEIWESHQQEGNTKPFTKALRFLILSPLCLIGELRRVGWGLAGGFPKSTRKSETDAFQPQRIWVPLKREMQTNTCPIQCFQNPER